MKKKAIPLILTAAIIGVDQLSKAIIVKKLPEEDIIDVFHNGFLWIWHVRNTAIAFSLGHNLPDWLKPIVIKVLPIAVLVYLVWFYLKSNELAPIQRWCLAGILGGGLGNLIDRIFRSDGVVDFISVKFYGFLGFARWPTFNLADSFVVVFGILFLITLILPGSKGKTKS
ncbi:MAG: signal peptidase II [Spirochaetaceae bacterium]|nr:signal peptidase II [Spirochaetaceae bacterium]